MNRREFLRRAAVGVPAASLGATGASAGGTQEAWSGPTVSTRGHYTIGGFNFVYRTWGVGEYEYETRGVPGMEGDASDEVALFVHGWLIDDADADTTFGIVRDTLRAVSYDAPLVGFEWDADQVYWFDDWYPSVEIARRNGGKLARFLADFRRANPDTAVRVIGHSLGTAVVLAALESLAADDHPTGDWDGVVESVTLLGAALDDEAPTAVGEYGEAVETRADEIDNFHTTADERLARGYRSVAFDDPLGTVGADGPTPTGYEDHRAASVRDHLDYYRQGVGVLDAATAEWHSDGGEGDSPDLPEPGAPDDPGGPDEPEEPLFPEPGGPDGPDDGQGEGDDRGGAGERRITGELPTGGSRTYTHEVGSGTERVVVRLSGDRDADLDLYVTRDGRDPTATDYDRAAWSLGSDERIALTDPGGSIGITVDAFTGGGGYTLTVEEA